MNIYQMDLFLSRANHGTVMKKMLLQECEVLSKSINFNLKRLMALTKICDNWQHSRLQKLQPIFAILTKTISYMAFKSVCDTSGTVVEPLLWRFSQCFGEKGNTADLTDGKQFFFYLFSIIAELLTFKLVKLI